jgi:hypothetical protein
LPVTQPRRFVQRSAAWNTRLIRRGYFVRALSANNTLCPALEMLRAALSSTRPTNRQSHSAGDPASYGVLLPGCGVSREAANLIVLSTTDASSSTRIAHSSEGPR